MTSHTMMLSAPGYGAWIDCANEELGSGNPADTDFSYWTGMGEAYQPENYPLVGDYRLPTG